MTRSIAGRLGDIGKFLLYLAIAFAVTIPINWLLERLHVSDAWQSLLAPLPTLVYGLNGIAHAAAATAPMAWLEKRSLFSYGFTPAKESLAQYAQGIALGVSCAAIVALLMVAFGGMQIHGFHLTGWQWAYPLAWGVALAVATLSEEAMLRGYALISLARGIGFWPAAIVTSLLFAWGHATKPGENLVDLSAIFVFGMLGCLAFARTGTLWLICGFHFAFDFMQLAVIGTPNGSQHPVGAILQATFFGPAWVNGGQLGTEASYFTFPAMALTAAYLSWRYPKRLRLLATT